ncbi:hypothetical protein CLOP_g1740 [Closterium sp. NIES-67]|nr:hypothetical protein CLOP_g1740 [Closterium sp. NIES-67]
MSTGATKQRSRRIAGALWTTEEDKILLAHVAKHGTHNWLLVKSMGLLPTRNHKACCNRYILLKRKLSKLGHRTPHMDMAAKGEISAVPTTPAVPTMPAVAAVPLLTAVPTVAADGGLTRDTAKAAKAGMAAVPTVPANVAAVPTMPRATGTAAAPTIPANAGMGTAKTTQQTLDERDKCLFRASFCHQQHSCCRQQQFTSCHQHHASSQHQHTRNHQQWDTEAIMAEGSPLMRGMQNSTAAAKAEGSCTRASGEPFASATLDLQIESATTVMSQANMEDEAAEAASDEMMVGITSPAAMSSHSLCAPKCVHIPTSRIISSAPKESLQTPQMHLSGSEHCLPVFPSQPLLQATSESSASKLFAAHLLPPPHRTVSLTLPPIRPPTLDLPPTRPPTPPTTPTTLPPPLSLPHGKVDNGTSFLVAAPAQELKGVETTYLVDSPIQDLEEIESFFSGALPEQTNLQMPQQVHQQVHQQENSAEGINAYCSLPVVANQKPLVYHAAQGAVSADTSHRHQHVPAGDAAANAPPPPSVDMAPPLYADAARFPTSPFAYAPSPTAPFPSAPCPTAPSAASSLSAGAILLAFADLLSAAAVSPGLPGPRCAAMAPSVSSDWPAAIDAAASTAAIDGAIASLLIQAELIRINNARLLLAPIPPTPATAIQPTSRSRTPVLRIPPLSLPPAAPPSAAAPPAAAAHQPSPPPPPTPPRPAAAAAAAATPATISSLFLGPSSSAAVAAADGRAPDDRAAVAAAEVRLKPDELFEAWCNGPFTRVLHSI